MIYIYSPGTDTDMTAMIEMIFLAGLGLHFFLFEKIGSFGVGVGVGIGLGYRGFTVF